MLRRMLGLTMDRVHIYLEYHMVSVQSFELGPPSSPASECVLPPEPKEVATHSPAGDGVGWSQFVLLVKKPSTLSTGQNC